MSHGTACVRLCDLLGFEPSKVNELLQDEVLVTALSRAARQTVELRQKRLSSGAILVESEFDYLGLNRLSALLFANHPQRTNLLRFLNDNRRGVDKLLQAMTPKTRQVLMMLAGVRNGLSLAPGVVARELHISPDAVERHVGKGREAAYNVVSQEGPGFFDLPKESEPVELITLPVGAVFRLDVGDDAQYIVEMQSSADYPGEPRTAVQQTSGHLRPGESKQPPKYLMASWTVIQIF